MSEALVEIRNLSRQFWRRPALCDVTWTIDRGSVYGLVGENGAGKTTLIRHLLGLLKAQSGSVTVFGLNPVQDPVAVLGRSGYLSESREMPEWMTVSELITYTRAFFPGWDDKFAEELRTMFELPRDQRIRTLSRGQRARAGLLTALAHRPELLILDEPSSGLDPIVRRDILTAIIRTVADEGRTVLFSSHLLEEVERVADRVAMLHRGRMVLSDALDHLLDDHHLLTVRFHEPQLRQPEWEGALSWSGGGLEWACLCNGQVEQLRRAAQAAHATIVEQRRPNLEEIFLARTSATKARESEVVS